MRSIPTGDLIYNINYEYLHCDNHYSTNLRYGTIHFRRKGKRSVSKQAVSGLSARSSEYVCIRMYMYVKLAMCGTDKLLLTGIEVIVLYRFGIDECCIAKFIISIHMHIQNTHTHAGQFAVNSIHHIIQIYVPNLVSVVG